jgi:hypothetical protein
MGFMKFTDTTDANQSYENLHPEYEFFRKCPEVFQHLLHNPLSSPSDFQLSGPLNKVTGDKKCEYNDQNQNQQYVILKASNNLYVSQSMKLIKR